MTRRGDAFSSLDARLRNFLVVGRVLGFRAGKGEMNPKKNLGIGGLYDPEEKCSCHNRFYSLILHKQPSRNTRDVSAG